MPFLMVSHLPLLITWTMSKIINPEVCFRQYYKTGFADQLDIFLLGAYLSTIYGPSNDESIEYSINRAKSYIGYACKIYGTIQCADSSFDVGEAAYYCLKQTSGLMIFDIVHVINNGK